MKIMASGPSTSWLIELYRTNNIDDHVCVYVCLSLSHGQLFATPQTTRGQMKIHYNEIYPKL